jgi:uncharacterized caspase-like protein
MKSKCLLLASVLLAISCPVQAQKKLALLIGNQAYNKNVGELKHPHEDVEVVSKALKKMGFSVTPVLDADFRTLHSAINIYANSLNAAGQDAIGFFYYSGHGAADQNTKIDYIIPTDVVNADTDSLWNNSIDIKADIINKLETMASGAVNFVVFDACRNELNLRHQDKALEVAGKAFVPIPTSGLGYRTLIAFSASTGRTTPDNGMYAKILVKELALEDEDAVVAFRNVQLELKKVTNEESYATFDGFIPPMYLAGFHHGSQGGATVVTMKGSDPSVGASPAIKSDCPEIAITDYSKNPPENRVERHCFQ